SRPSRPVWFASKRASRLPRRLEGEVDDAGVATRRGDAAKAGRVEVLCVVDEVRVVEHVDERRLQLQLDPLGDGQALDEARVADEVLRPVERVDGEVAEEARLGRAQNPRLDGGADE